MSNINNGRYVVLINDSTNTLIFKNEDQANSNAATRFCLVSSTDINILPNGSITFIYAQTVVGSRWICISKV